MAQQGAALQTYNLELIKGIEDMKRKRSELQQLIEEQEDEKITLQREMEKMSFRLAQINACLSQMTAARSKYDHTITETEAAYTKILESSQVLLNMVRTEASCLEQTLAKKINADESHCLVRHHLPYMFRLTTESDDASDDDSVVSRNM